jgi:hypothetical protein
MGHKVQSVQTLYEDSCALYNDIVEGSGDYSAKTIISYQSQEFQLGEILAKLALNKINTDIDTNWGNLKPLYIQPPAVHLSTK